MTIKYQLLNGKVIQMLSSIRQVTSLNTLGSFAFSYAADDSLLQRSSKEGSTERKLQEDQEQCYWMQ